jgi:protein-disulfide isomerase
VRRFLNSIAVLAGLVLLGSPIGAYAAEASDPDGGFVAGNPKGDVTVVEFFDHNCPYCRAADFDLLRLLAHDRRVRLVLREYPVLGPDSEAVAMIALAATRQGQYMQLTQKLFRQSGRATRETALDAAQDLGLDMAQLERDMNSISVLAELNANRLLAKSLGVRGVPFYVVGGKALPDVTDNVYGDLTTAIAEYRQRGADLQEE